MAGQVSLKVVVFDRRVELEIVGQEGSEAPDGEEGTKVTELSVEVNTYEREQKPLIFER